MNWTLSIGYIDIPLLQRIFILQAETRKIYQTLLDEDNEFTGFEIGPKYVS